MTLYPWRQYGKNTTEEIASQVESQWETPGGAQQKADQAEENAKKYADENFAKNAFSKVASPGRATVESEDKEDTLTLEAGTGIAITTDPAQKKVTIWTQGDSAPGAHGETHNHDGSDPIPDLVQVQQDLAEHLDEDVSDDAHGFLTTKRMHVGTFTRSTTLDSGIQAITGIGFRPKLVLFLATVVAMEGLMSIGFDDGASPTCLFDNHLSTPNSYSSAGYSIRIQQGSSGGFRYSGRIQALNSDGFTMLWDKSDRAVEGQTIQVNYVAFM